MKKIWYQLKEKIKTENPYLGLMGILSVFLVVGGFSFAFYSAYQESRGSLNIITGTLVYKIESEELKDNKIEIGQSMRKEIQIEVESLNEVETLYQLYYTLNKEIEGVEVGYQIETENLPKEEIEQNGKAIITIVIKNYSQEEVEITFGIQGGLAKRNFELKSGRKEIDKISDECHYQEGSVFEYDYTGEEQEFMALCAGDYRMEAWGAQGGLDPTIEGYEGFGGYSKGEVTLTENQKLYINVGGQGEGYNGEGSRVGREYKGGYNGGGNGISMDIPSHQQVAYAGGGATHVATETGLLSTLSSKRDSILIVAGGGGGNGVDAKPPTGGNGGGFKGGDGINAVAPYTGYYGTGATQTEGGHDVTFPNEKGSIGTFGQGGKYYLDPTGSGGQGFGGAGGGGGYFGGGGSSRGHGGAGGGSGYIGNSKLKNKEMYCYNCATDTNVNTKTYTTTNKNQNPISQYAKQGNGYFRILYLGQN